MGAHSYYNGKRFFNTADIDEYLKGKASEEEIILTEADKMSEFMIMGLRKTSGIKIAEFKKRFSKDIHDVYNTERFEKCGLIINDGENMYLSERGLDVSNSILCEFV